MHIHTRMHTQASLHTHTFMHAHPSNMHTHTYRHAHPSIVAYSYMQIHNCTSIIKQRHKHSSIYKTESINEQNNTHLVILTCRHTNTHTHRYTQTDTHIHTHTDTYL